MTLIYLCLAWLVGILLGSLQRADIRVIGLLCLLPLPSRSCGGDSLPFA